MKYAYMIIRIPNILVWKAVTLLFNIKKTTEINKTIKNEMTKNFGYLFTSRNSAGKAKRK